MSVQGKSRLSPSRTAALAKGSLGRSNSFFAGRSLEGYAAVYISRMTPRIELLRRWRRCGMKKIYRGTTLDESV